jgi:hypothetical protein
MAVTVKKAVLWRKEIDNRPGMLANILGPLSIAGADLQVVMAYRYPGGKDMAAIELHPISGRKSMVAAKKAALAQSRSPSCWSKETIGRGSATPSQKRSVRRGSI